MSLGADAAAVRNAVVRRALAAVAAGLAFGVGAGALAGMAIAHLVFQVAPMDFPAIAAVSVGLILLGWLAAILPARHASRVQPAEALRQT